MDPPDFSPASSQAGAAPHGLRAAAKRGASLDDKWLLRIPDITLIPDDHAAHQAATRRRTRLARLQRPPPWDCRRVLHHREHCIRVSTSFLSHDREDLAHVCHELDQMHLVALAKSLAMGPLSQTTVYARPGTPIP